METSISDVRHAVLHLQNRQVMSGTHRDMLIHGPKVALLNPQNDRLGLGPIETSYSGA